MSGKIKKSSVGSKIKKLKSEGRSQKQAVAIAMNMASSFIIAPWAILYNDFLPPPSISSVFQQILEQAYTVSQC